MAAKLLLPTLFLLGYLTTATLCYSRGDPAADLALYRAQRWVLKQRDPLYGWSTGLGLNVSETGRAVVALQLADPGWFSGSCLQTQLTGKQLDLEVLAAVLEYCQHASNVSSSIYGRMAQYSYALMSICRNPRNLWGHDIIAPLVQRAENGHPFVDAYITLAVCTSRTPVPRRQVDRLIQVASEVQFVDSLAMIVMALHCVTEQEYDSAEEMNQISAVKQAQDMALAKLTGSMKSDGSFGNIYSTALAMQALSCCSTQAMELTRSHLLAQQEQDGSFGNLFATLEVLRGLSGKSYSAVQYTFCHETGISLTPVEDDAQREESIQNRNITGTYTLWIQCDTTQCYDDLVDQHVFSYEVPEGTVFYDIMVEAAEKDSHFKFEYKQYSFGKFIHTINGLSNQDGRNVYWMLYKLPQIPNFGSKPGLEYQASVGVDDLIPKQGDHILFWYNSVIF